ncbi:putative protein of unknown function [Candida albicans P60002]|uniref:Uncharacterized protein n=2 Tax=Candida albicans TaxID=5476 RepID=C4YSS8_CANAW|nr:conserved hypothetical protein [Candida albicans WO-1]KGQ84206.1 hypothetical protein MEO_04636 [Candida albicans P94015]KGQ88454.1 hypothetical protein MG1_04708 [Candida albicans GC75]KGR07439.1 hypothetical protein MG3_04716 [Candida albicans P78048]KGU04809.1 hypothetical protein MEQ_04666 [Candida albicans P87]KGU25105.1 putative protein of unknown function [Candida albicans P75063]KGU25760.1 putative protein of unknown function [Candida albicans P57055]KHC33820.1 putative protein of
MSTNSFPILKTPSTSNVPTITRPPLQTNSNPLATKSQSTITQIPSSQLHYSTRTRSTTINEINELIKQDYKASHNKFNSNSNGGKIKLLDDVDLEKQLIETAGGKNHVWTFILKLVILTILVLGSGILIFYAL